MSKFGNPSGEYEPLWIKEELEEYGISQAEIARRLNLTPSRVCAVLNGRQCRGKIVSECIFAIGQEINRGKHGLSTP